MTNQFLYGASLYSAFDNNVEKIIKKMKAGNIDIIRTAEIFNSWSTIEYKEGTYDFSQLDEIFELCQKYDMKVLLGTGTANPPLWFSNKYPDSIITDNLGHTYPMNVSYSWACSDSDPFLNIAQKYIETLVKRYNDNTALFGYQIHNEVGFPFMPLSGDNIHLYCYCKHSKLKYREFLKKKYSNSLEELNKAYSWVSANNVYTSWEEVEPPQTMPISWSSVTRWLDFRLFAMHRFVAFIKWQDEIIKRLDDVHVTSTNIFFMNYQDPLASITAIDQFEIAKQVDCIGYDIYPGSYNRLEKTPEFSSLLLDHGRSVAFYAQKDFWLLETESGPINGWVAGPYRNTVGRDIYRNVFDGLGHGIKLLIYQLYKAQANLPLHWGEVLDVDGNETRNYNSVANIAEFIKKEGRNIDNAKVTESEVAIVVGKENNIVLTGMDLEDFGVKAIRGAYRHFWEKGFSIDFITPDIICTHALNYKIVYMPFFVVMDIPTIEALLKYVHNGGVLIATSRVGMLDEYAWLRNTIPYKGMSEVLGIEAKYTTVIDDHPDVWYEGKMYKGYHHKDEISLKTAEPLAYFEDDTVAVTKNDYGRGHAIFFGTHPDIAHLEGSDLLWMIVKDVCRQYAISPRLYLEYTKRAHKEFDAHYLQSIDYDYIIITHYIDDDDKLFSGQKKMVNVFIDAEFDKIELEKQEDFVSQDIAYTHKGLYKQISLSIEKGKVYVLKLFGRKRG